MKGQIAQVPFGNFEIEGVLGEDGNFYVSVSQINSLTEFSVTQNYASQSLKRIAGKDLTVTQIKLDNNSKKQNCIALECLNRVLTDLAVSGNKKALEFVHLLSGLSLTQLFSDAFGIKFTQEDRQQYLAERMLHRASFHPKLTRWWKADGCSSGMDYVKRLSQFKKAAGLPGNLKIEQMEYADVSLLNRAEEKYDMLRLKLDMTHDEAINTISV